MVSEDPYAHCRRGARPYELWWGLALVGSHHGLPTETLQLIHRYVACLMPAEMEGQRIVTDRLEREKAARASHGANPPCAQHELLGFATFEGYRAQVQAEKRQYEEAERLKCIKSLPRWALFDCESKEEYDVLVKAQRKAERIAHRRESKRLCNASAF